MNKKKLTINEEKIAERVAKMWGRAREIWVLPDIKTTLSFTNNRAMAKLRASKKHSIPAGILFYNREENSIKIMLNREAIRQNFLFVLDDVVPHEIAHAVCVLKPECGKEHDEGWKHVCKQLGGTGNSTFSNECDLRVIKHPVFVYRVEGHVIELSRQRHEALQARTCLYKIKNGTLLIEPHHFTGLQR